MRPYVKLFSYSFKNVDIRVVRLYHISMSKKSFTTSDIAQSALFCALMVAGAFIRIPFPVVPLTFQTAFAVLAGLLLGWEKGVIATTAYMLLGLFGLPVFTSGGGFSYVFNPSFGFIVGFIAAAGVGGIGAARFSKLWQKAAFALLACLANYVIGGAYVYGWLVLNASADIVGGMVSGVLIFLPKDILLSLLAALVACKVYPAARGARLFGGNSKRRK